MDQSKENKDPHKITFEQFKGALIQKQVSLTLTDVTDLFRVFDHQDDGTIDYDEFIFHIRVIFS